MGEDQQPTSLGAYVHAERERAGLTQRQLAALAGLHHSFLARLENGEIADRPTPQHLQRIADALELDVRDLLAFLGVNVELPEPRVYFRTVYGVSDNEARAMVRLLEQRRSNDQDNTNQ